jgi:hypothetical protein
VATILVWRVCCWALENFRARQFLQGERPSGSEKADYQLKPITAWPILIYKSRQKSYRGAGALWDSA